MNFHFHVRDEPGKPPVYVASDPRNPGVKAEAPTLAEAMFKLALLNEPLVEACTPILAGG